MRLVVGYAFILILGGLAAVFPWHVQAQRLAGQNGVFAACQADIAANCESVRPGKERIAACLRENRASLSDACRKVVGAGGARASATGGETPAEKGPAGRVLRDVAYGPSQKQRMDFHVPAGARNAPVIFMVHGGGWSTGSKSAPGVIDGKAAFWLPRGYIVVSADYRLLPEADPLSQAADIARAIAFAQKRVQSLGGDPDRFVLMGHSAGAHLLALLSADPAMAAREGARPWRAAVLLDSAAYDVAALMKAPHARLYDKAFGDDPGFWHKASPIDNMTRRAPPMLLVCSTRRETSCGQAESFSRKGEGMGVRMEVLPAAKSHAAINRDVGQSRAYTAAIARFIEAAVR